MSQETHETKEAARLKNHIFVSIATTALLLAVPASAGRLIAGDIDTDNFYYVETQTAQATFVGNLGINLSFGGFGFDSSTQTLYGSDFFLPVADAFGLTSIDPLTGVASEIGSHVNSNNIWGLAYDSANDVLYGADGSNEGLATIDRGTGVSSLIGLYAPGQPAPLICALAYDAATDTLYGVDSYDVSAGGASPERVHGNGQGNSPEGSGTNSRLYTINRTTGAATAVGFLGATLDSADVRCGLAIDRLSGELYAGGYDGSLYRLDKATGAATLIGDTGIAIDALESLPDTANWVDVPTLAPSALGLLAALLALGGFFLLRRR